MEGLNFSLTEIGKFSERYSSKFNETWQQNGGCGASMPFNKTLPNFTSIIKVLKKMLPFSTVHEVRIH